MFRDFDSRPSYAEPANPILPLVAANDEGRRAGRLTARWLRGPDGRLERIWVRIVDHR